jgi:hypothetical protein
MKLLRLVLLFLLASVTAHAYVLNGPKWPAPYQVLYYINPSSQDLSEADVIGSIQAGASAWASAQSGANVHPTYAGTTTGNVLLKNFRNEVFFRDASGGSLYGETLWWYDGANNLIEADILFYDAVKFFASHNGCVDGVYLQDATAHEFGHALGFGHSDVEGATMVHWMPYCSTDWRTLHEDDLAGLRLLYPPISQPPPPQPTPTPTPTPDPTPVPQPTGLTLTVRGYKVKGLQKVDLTWSGSTVAQVDLYRGRIQIATTYNDGSFTDAIDRRGGGSYSYQVCEAGTSVCSALVTVAF